MVEANTAQHQKIDARGAAGAGMTILSAVAPALGIPIPHWVLWLAFTAGLVLLCWGPTIALIKAARKMETPQVLMVVGLAGILIFAALALGGMVWSYSRAPSPNVASAAPPSTIAAPNTASPSAAAPSKSILRERTYLKEEKEDLGAKLRRISTTIHGTGDEILKKAEIALNHSLWERSNVDVAPEIQRIDDIRNLTVEMHKALYEGLLDPEREFREELNAVLFPKEPFTDFQIAANEFHNGLTVWMKLRDSADSPTRDALQRLTGASRMTFGRARDKFLAWLSQRLEIIDQARRDLGK